jgi:nuclease-like protein
MFNRSPLKAKPLRNPGDSVDEEIRRWIDDRATEPLWFAGGFFLIASMEWFGYLTHSSRRPLLFTAVALVAIAFAVWRLVVIRVKVKQLKLGRDGERCVGQFLERLREGGGQVFHDIPGEGFNLDHVVISPHGLFVIETKTVSKPWPKATIRVEGDSLLVGGQVPDRNPSRLAQGLAEHYGISESDVWKALDSMPIVHVHGSFGLLPEQSSSDQQQSFAFGAFLDDALNMSRAILRAEHSIKIVHEASETDDGFASAKRFFQAAQQVLFLGFSFAETAVSRR